MQQTLASQNYSSLRQSHRNAGRKQKLLLEVGWGLMGEENTTFLNGSQTRNKKRIWLTGRFLFNVSCNSSNSEYRCKTCIVVPSLYSPSQKSRWYRLGIISARGGRMCGWLEFFRTINGWRRWYWSLWGIHRRLKPELESQLDESELANNSRGSWNSYRTTEEEISQEQK